MRDMDVIDLQDIASYGNNVDSGYASSNNGGTDDGSLSAIWDRNTTYFRAFAPTVELATSCSR